MTRAKCGPGSLHDRIVRDGAVIRNYVIKDGHLFLSLLEDAGTYELRKIRERRLTVSGSCGDDHCASGIVAPSSSLTPYGLRSQVRSTALFAIVTSAPNFCAWA